MRSTRKAWCFILIVGLLLLDQWSKAWVASHLVRGEFMPLNTWFNLRLAHNTGAAFSLFRNSDGTISTWALFFLIGLASGVSVALAWWLFMRKRSLSALRALSLSLILAGALGNVIDRVRLGYVVDFFDFHVGDWHYATFNVADCAVVIGVLLLIICPPPVDKEILL